VLLIILIGIAYSVVAPLMTPFALAYMATAWLLWRYQASGVAARPSARAPVPPLRWAARTLGRLPNPPGPARLLQPHRSLLLAPPLQNRTRFKLARALCQILYVCVRCYESGGRMWPVYSRSISWCLAAFVIFTACIFLLKKANAQGLLALCLLPGIFFFSRRCRLRYDVAVESMPLWLAHAAPRTRVDPQVRLPGAPRWGGGDSSPHLRPSAVKDGTPPEGWRARARP
jgi:hypothetical protein